VPKRIKVIILSFEMVYSTYKKAQTNKYMEKIAILQSIGIIVTKVRKQE